MGPGGDYNGPTLKSIIANKNGKLDDIEKIINEKGQGGEFRFAEHLKNLNELNTVVNLKELDLPKVKQVIANLGENFTKKQKEFKLSSFISLWITMWTILKCHRKHYSSILMKYVKQFILSTEFLKRDMVTKTIRKTARATRKCNTGAWFISTA